MFLYLARSFARSFFFPSSRRGKRKETERRLPFRVVRRQQVQVQIPLVPYHLAAREAAHWNYHLQYASASGKVPFFLPLSFFLSLSLSFSLSLSLSHFSLSLSSALQFPVAAIYHARARPRKREGREEGFENDQVKGGENRREKGCRNVRSCPNCSVSVAFFVSDESEKERTSQPPETPSEAINQILIPHVMDWKFFGVFFGFFIWNVSVGSFPSL